MYHGYHFAYLVLFLFIFYGIFVKKTLPEDKKKGFFWKLAQIILKDVSNYFTRGFIHHLQ